VYHLAAVYDLGVSETVAKRVNVDGTRHVSGSRGVVPTSDGYST